MNKCSRAAVVLITIQQLYCITMNRVYNSPLGCLFSVHVFPVIVFSLKYLERSLYTMQLDNKFADVLQC